MGVNSSKLNEEVELLLREQQADPTVVTAGLHDQLISSFLEIAVGHTVETARYFLHTTNWNLEESINLFLLNDTLDPSMYHHNDQEPRHEEILEDYNDDDGDDSESRLSSLYRPPYNILFDGWFEDAKTFSTQENKWLMVNLQSRTEFASLTLNRDVWSNDAVSQAVESSFVLWQVYDDTVEGQKISTFYKLESAAPPLVLLLDPITGQKMRMWSGEIEAQGLLEDLVKFMESGPHEHIASLSRHRGPETKVTYSSSNQVPPPSWGDEFEEEDSSSSRNMDQVSAPSWGEEFEEEGNSSSSNHTGQVVAPSWGEEFEKEETCVSSNNTDGESEEVKEEEEETCCLFPELTEEPMGDCDRNLVCNLCVRFPDGRRKQRKFLKTEPIQLLWSFCYSQMEVSERKAFKLVQAIPRASKTLDYEVNDPFEQSGLANSMISVTWE
ncbi:unnamed protein product [Microthlaspi erraticum]|uniref:UBX domain-containing protein n=1 Tax=Microthlaspi erraticum TaxID=1685480 RepID=A0A6D2IR01_9BRAS|nr:unnamed protein product [Microthlaspi erraticum]